MSTHNQCFRAKIRKNVCPGKPQFYYINVGCKGVFVTRTCFHDEKVVQLEPKSCPRNLEHYANTPMQYTAIFHGSKNVHFQMIS